MNKDWNGTRFEILRRDKYQCRLCGESEHLDVHHLAYDMFDKNTSSNKHLITLCDKCHGQISGLSAKDAGKVIMGVVDIDTKTIRKGKGMTQDAFAALLGVSVMTVRRWESGKTKPSRMAQKLLNAVGEQNA